MKKNILSLALALLLLSGTISGVLISCGSAPAPEAQSDETTAAEEVTTVSPEQQLLDSLAVKDYGGYEFRVMTAFSNYAITAFDFDTMSGELIEDTIYNRNRAVEEKLNVKIVNTKGADGDYGAVDNMLRKNAASGDDMFDLMFSEAGISGKSAAGGYMLNLLEIPGVEWSNPWWEQNAVELYQISDRLFYTYSPMHLHYYESVIAPCFNKTVAENYGIEDLYKTVRDKKWTLDRMFEIASSVNLDLDGDGQMNSANDLFGIDISTIALCYFALGAGGSFIQRSGDSVTYDGLSERVVSIAEKMQTIFSDKAKYIGYDTPGNESYNNGYIGAFIANHALFFVDVLGEVRGLRAMDADFGILPMPMYDESQPDYLSTCYCGAAIMFVPVSNATYAENGPILEMLGAYSWKDLKPAYYEINIQGKVTRDEESIEMLKILTDNMTFDLGLLLQLGGMNGKFNEVAMSTKSPVTEFEKIANKIGGDLEKLLESYENL